MKIKKLTLSKETLRVLTEAEGPKVVGGYTGGPTCLGGQTSQGEHKNEPTCTVSVNNACD